MHDYVYFFLYRSQFKAENKLKQRSFVVLRNTNIQEREKKTQQQLRKGQSEKKKTEKEEKTSINLYAYENSS